MRSFALAALAGLVAVQEPSPVPALLARIDGKDPAAAFKAIADLADLDATRREEIRKGAATLPEFYRDALLAELSAPPARRLAWSNASRTFEEYLTEFERSTGTALDRNPAYARESNAEYFELALDGAPPLRALGEICTRAGKMPWFHPITGKVRFQDRAQTVIGTSGGGAMMLCHGWSWNLRADLGRPSSWSVGLGFSALVGRPDAILEWTDVRCVEAVSDAGMKLEPLPRDIDSRHRFEERLENLSIYMGRSFGVGVKVPTDTRAIRSLKLSATARVAEKFRLLELPIEKREGPCVVEADGWRAAVSGFDPGLPNDTRIRVRLRAKDVPGADLMSRPFLAESSYRDQVFDSAPVTRLRLVDGEVELLIRCFPLSERDFESITGPLPQVIRILAPELIVERKVFAEFRDLPLR